MNFLVHLTSKIAALLLLKSALTAGSTAATETTASSPGPHYRFHYIVKDEKTGDYKSQEERRNGDSVTGSYTVAEPNGDLRVVNYVADVSSGFKAAVNVQPGASPVKATSASLKDATGPYNNHRTGISAPPKNRKPARGFHPIVVKSLSLTQPPQMATQTSEPSQPYLFYKDPKNESTLLSASTSATKKSVHVDLTIDEPAVIEKAGGNASSIPSHGPRPTFVIETSTDAKNLDFQSPPYLGVENVKTISPANGLYQLRNMDIPSSVMEILNQNKVKLDNVSGDNVPITTTIPTISSGTPKTLLYEAAASISSVKIDLARNSENATTESSKLKENLPQRPMRLIGLSPIYIDNTQLQTVTDNLTSIPQLHLEPLSNIQYATPTPLYQGPLPGGPAGPFRNVPRSVNDPNAAEIAVYNTMPLINSIPISAPIITAAAAAQTAGSIDPKPEPKLENKLPPMQSTLPLCSDCLLPSNYVPYPVVKVSAASPVVTTGGVGGGNGNNINGISGNGGGNQKTSPCSSNNASPLPAAPASLWPPYTPSFAYILMPTPILKSKINETRPLVNNIWSK